MESDTTVPGDKLNDPVETPAGKRESTSVFSIAVISNKQPAIVAFGTHLCVFIAQSAFLLVTISGFRKSHRF